MMTLREIPDDLWLYIARGCDGPDINTMASMCQHFRQLFRRSRPLVMVATPAGIQSGMFHWLEQCISDSAGGGPPMGALTIVLPDMPDDHQGHPESRRQTEFLCALRVAVAAIPIVKLIIGPHVSLSLPLLADALQSIAYGGRLSLDLSDRVMYQQHLSQDWCLFPFPFLSLFGPILISAHFTRPGHCGRHWYN